MKTPEEWIKSKTRLVNKNVITGHFWEEDIRAIQEDAIITALTSLDDPLGRIESLALEVRKATRRLPLEVRRKISTIANVAHTARINTKG